MRVASASKRPSRIGAYQAACDSRIPLVEPKTTTFVTCPEHVRESSSCTAASWVDVRPGAASAHSASGSSSTSRAAGIPTQPTRRATSTSTIDAVALCERLRPAATSSGIPYGGVVALLAAARRAGADRLVDRDRAARDGRRAGNAGGRQLHRGRGGVVVARPDATIRRLSCAGSCVSSAPTTTHPRRCRRQLEQGARALIVRARQWEAQIPLSTLAAAPFPESRRLGRSPRRLRCRLRRARRSTRRRAARARRATVTRRSSIPRSTRPGGVRDAGRRLGATTRPTVCRRPR